MRRTLRIKRVFFDAIANGEKEYEYRSNTDFYQRIFLGGEKVTRLMLHYQRFRTMEVEVLSIRLVNKPKHLKDSPYLYTPKVFKIKLGQIIKLSESYLR